MASKWEAALVTQLIQSSQDVYAGERWPYPAPIAQYHPDWCCPCTKPKHGWRGLGAQATAWCNGCESAHVYLKGRDWAIDAAYPDLKVAVEYEGVVWAKKGEQVGRHQTGAGMTADLAKYGWLVEHGWQVVRLGQRQVSSGEALTIVQAALRQASALKAATA